MKKILTTIVIFGISILILLIATKGEFSANALNFQNNYDTKVGGPYESSNSKGRYALTRSIVEDSSTTFNLDLARFSSPDVAEYNGKFFSIFTPGVSFLGIPFYMLGKLFGAPQIFTYFTTAIFALLNVFIIAKLSQKLGSSFYAGLFGGFIFLFASSAFAYTLTFTQHHYSTTVILLSLLLAVQKISVWRNIFLGALMGIALLFDFPNLILLLPIMLFVAVKHLQVSRLKAKVKVAFNTLLFAVIVGMIPFFALFGWYNYQTTGTLTKTGQFLGRAETFNTQIQRSIASQEDPYLIRTPFETRRQLNGFYILLLSDERSWLHYSPVILAGFLGLYLTYKKSELKTLATISLAVILTNILLYAMFVDPWGGWSFGARYLIPSAAILAAGVGVALYNFKKNFLFLGIFLIALIYSVQINSLGVLTTSAIPPKVEAIHLSKPIPYTYQYNYDFAESGRSSALLYNTVIKQFVSVNDFISYYSVLIVLFFIALYLLVIKTTERENV